MNKQEKIEQFKNQPLTIGQRVLVKGFSFGDKSRLAKIVSLNPLIVSDEDEAYLNIEIKENQITEIYTRHIGSNPFSTYRTTLKIFNSSIRSIFNATGINDKTNKNIINGVIVPESNWNPYIIKDGKKVYYQRDFCWTLEDKQLLIESIYLGIDCGKIVVRNRSFSWVERQIKNNDAEVSFKDIVDGKQRLNALEGFVNNVYPDTHGNYYRDLSDISQGLFMNYMGFTYGELEEYSTDDDVIKTFLMVNHSGKPQSAEHINFVKSLL